MKDYKDNYVFKYERDSKGQIYNRDDNYLSCRARGKIYRYNSDTLVFYSTRRIKLKKVDKETNQLIFDYTPLLMDVIDSDEERLIYFKEENFDNLKDLFKVREKRKMSEEAKLAAKIRLQEARLKKGITSEITEDDLEEELNNDDIDEGGDDIEEEIVSVIYED